MMRIVQVELPVGVRTAVVETKHQLRVVDFSGGTYALVCYAIEQGEALEAVINKYLGDECLDYSSFINQQKILAPITHPDDAHCLISGTGLTHLGSASTRSEMHTSSLKETELTDTMRMFKSGLDGGRPEAGQVGAQPEWFYKGDGSIIAAPGGPIAVPAFAEDVGEEPELVGIYVNAADGSPWRVGFAIGNEFSDHITERANYLWLAHSKLRACSFGPELLIGQLPAHLAGESRIIRHGVVIWSKPFLTGEDNMAHSFANLEHHHFKYTQFQRPGGLHVHFFGTATLSFADGISVEPGDLFEIELPALGRKLSNTVLFDDTDKNKIYEVQVL